jgi:signal transduction histidine kinase
LTTATPEDVPAELLELLAHDLRNPLAALTTNLHFVDGALERAGGEGELREAMADALSLCASIERLVGNVHVLGAGAREANRTPTALRPLVEAAVARIAPEAQAVGSRIEVHVTAEPMALVAREPLAAALSNLLANAVEHAPRGSTVTVSIDDREGLASIEVRDDGPAVPTELRALAVSPRAYAGAARTPGSRLGRGLSLLCAASSARVAGARLTIGDVAGCSSLRLVADGARGA